jgi:uncharacterized GH25 family protein
MRKLLLTAAAALMTAAAAAAHDPWVQTTAAVLRVGDAVHIDLMLGNHGNDHRDFKLAGKVSLAATSAEVIGPDGRRYDLKGRFADTGYTPKEGFWTARFAGTQPGLHAVAVRSDKVVTYAPKRSVQGAKAYFLLSPSLDRVSRTAAGFEKPLGHPLELVPEASPVAPAGPGVPIKVRLLFRGKPLAGARVSFIPRGEALSEGFDQRYERRTDADGRATFTPTEGNYYLVVAHHETDEKGPGYDSTKYSATLTVLVPEVCPCCGE